MRFTYAWYAGSSPHRFLAALSSRGTPDTCARARACWPARASPRRAQAAPAARHSRPPRRESAVDCAPCHSGCCSNTAARVPPCPRPIAAPHEQRADSLSARCSQSVSTLVTIHQACTPRATRAACAAQPAGARSTGRHRCAAACAWTSQQPGLSGRRSRPRALWRLTAPVRVAGNCCQAAPLPHARDSQCARLRWAAGAVGGRGRALSSRSMTKAGPIAARASFQPRRTPAATTKTPDLASATQQRRDQGSNGINKEQT